MPAKLQWVEVDGEVVHIGRYAHIKPKLRPQALCPVCRDPVVMKLGSKMAHHCAHKPDADCAATAGETAVHLNSKLYIARKLNKELARSRQEGDSPRLYIKEVCGWKDGAWEKTCTECRTTEWARDWDEVAVELRVGNRQPDITLLRAGEAIGAIEVHVTNAVSEEKAADLRALNLPWVEVKGTPELYEGDRPWSAMVPLKASTHSEQGHWRCPKCAEKAAQAAKREHARNNGWHDRLYRVVDFYYSSGKKFREMYVVQHLLKDGQEIGFLLKSTSKAHNLLTVSQDSPDPMRRMASCFRHSVNRKGAALVDDSMRWQPAEELLFMMDTQGFDPMRMFWKFEWHKPTYSWRKRRRRRQRRWS